MSRLDDLAKRNPAAATRLGIVLLVVGLAVVALVDALVKLLSADLPMVMIQWGRFTAGLAVLAPVVLVIGGGAVWRPSRPLLHLIRAGLMAPATLLFGTAISGMPLADAIAIAFVYPFMIAVLAVIFLKERASLPDWIAIAAGFAGVLIVMRPQFGQIDEHALLAFVTGCLFAAYLIMTRTLSGTASNLQLAFYPILVCALTFSLIVPQHWVTPSAYHALLLGITGAISVLAHGIIILAVRLAPAPRLAPFGYSEIIWAVLIGFWLFGDLPDIATWLGIAVIMSSGVFIALRGTRTKTGSTADIAEAEPFDVTALNTATAQEIETQRQRPPIPAVPTSVERSP